MVVQWFCLLIRLPSLVIYVKETGEMFRSTDNGVNWTLINDGLPYGIVRSMVVLASGLTSDLFRSITIDQSGIIYAGSWGRGIFRSGQPAGVDSPDDPVHPASRVSLRQNFPNPFNPVTSIQYSLPAESHVRIDVYTITGHHMATLVDDVKSAGNHEVVLEGRDLVSGVYLYSIEVDEHKMVRKMVLLR